jgi:hypothetical protein
MNATSAAGIGHLVNHAGVAARAAHMPLSFVNDIFQ